MGMDFESDDSFVIPGRHRKILFAFGSRQFSSKYYLASFGCTGRRLLCSALNLESRPSGAVRTSQIPYPERTSRTRLLASFRAAGVLGSQARLMTIWRADAERMRPSARRRRRRAKSPPRRTADR